MKFDEQAKQGYIRPIQTELNSPYKYQWSSPNKLIEISSVISEINYANKHILSPYYAFILYTSCKRHKGNERY
jgi:hypothetical protein